jgi:anti-sigma regulatory factor (Ser/Thr protein kinase)
MVRTDREFTSDLRHLGEMRALVREACSRAWGPAADEEVLGRLELAVTEAATNVIRHAYQGETGRPIHMVIEAGDDQVSVSLYHHGKDFDPDSVAPPTFDGSREGGYGLYLIRESVDDVRYFRDDQGRSGICLVKKKSRS